jgi:hypothetical protein
METQNRWAAAVVGIAFSGWNETLIGLFSKVPQEYGLAGYLQLIASHVCHHSTLLSFLLCLVGMSIP